MCIRDRLGVEQAVGDGVAGIKADEGAGGAGLDVAAPFLVACLLYTSQILLPDAAGTGGDVVATKDVAEV